MFGPMELPERQDIASEHDIAVIGGGPAGSAVALRTAMKGVSVIVLEEDPAIGDPVHCAGLISVKTIDLAQDLGVPDDAIESTILREIRGAVIHSPSGRTFSMRKDDVHAVVIDRARFDSVIAEAAERAGATYALSSKVTDIRRVEDGFDLQCSTRDGLRTDVKARRLVGADGFRSTVAAKLDLGVPRSILPALQTVVEDWQGEPDMVHVVLDPDIAEGFFAWVVPEKVGARIGLASTGGRLNERLDRVVSNLSELDLTSGKSTGYQGGGIPIGPADRTADEGVLTVGDAAGQVKPVSGGGIFPGLECANIAADQILRSLEDDDPLIVNDYEQAWRERWGKELNLGYHIRMGYTHLNSKKVEKLAEVLSREKLIPVFEECGDMDYPSKLIRPLFRKAPGLIGFAGPLLKGIFRSRFGIDK